ncbi:MAG: Gx transporter family protein [Firmicutes bacterium]|nr:Gx transporter family protein [Bacillota bacterium]
MKTKTLTRTALLFALSIVMAYLEHLIPPLPFAPPGVKLGLSNIITMYTLFFIGVPQAFLIAVLKAGFVLLTRGTIASLLSLSGGLVSVGVMALLSLPGRKDDSKKFTYLFLSICGALSHNLGQLVVVYLMISHSFLAYVPVLIISGIVMGIITGSLLRLLLPALHRSFGIGWKGGA